MDSPSLNILTVQKLAYRKGFKVERTATIKERRYVAIYDAVGHPVDGAKLDVGFSLREAKRLLEALPDVNRRAILTP
jgi:hypothetical protein